MATVTANLALDMLNIQRWDGTLDAPSATEIRFTDHVSRSCIYSGTGFSWDGTTLGGTGTGFAFYASANYTSLSWSITGGSIPANDVKTYVTNNDISGFTQFALSGNDSITGSAFADKLYGYSGNDTIIGGAGDDALNGGTGDDALLGGTGDDAYFVNSFYDVVTEKAGEGWDMLNSSLSGYTLSSNVEGLALAGTVTDGYGNSLDNYIVGNTANNRIDGGVGADYMAGGLGNDMYIIDTFSDNVVENANEGWDQVISSQSGYVLGANVEGLSLAGTATDGYGNSIDNYMMGNDADNRLDGGAGADTMIGSKGNDMYIVDSLADNVVENANEGWDQVVASVSGYTLAANIEGLSLAGTAAQGYGNSLNNLITGNNSDNYLSGNAGSDNIQGGAGNDTLVGGLGADTLTGGTGNDRFVFDSTLGSGIDTITDFSPSNDTIVLENAIFASLTSTGALAAGSFVTGTPAADANDYIIYNSATGALYYDADGNGAGAAQQFATLSTHPTITNANFSIT